MTTNDWSWKPDGNVVKFVPRSTRAKIKSDKRKKAIKNRGMRIAEHREAMLRRFGLHQYSSWTAIAEMICKETGQEIPGTKAQCRKLVIKYRPSNEKSERQYYPRTTNEQFYASNAWKELRYIALRQSGGCCTLCGARASDGIQLHVDHIIPRSKDARKELDLDNLQILCDDCNIGKSNRDDTDWRKHESK